MDDLTSNNTDSTDSSSEISTVDNSSILLNLDDMIKSHLSSIDRMSDELKKQNDMLNAIFENDPTYQEHTKAAKEAARVKSATKQQILKQPQAADLNLKVKNMRSEMKQLQEALSDYLKEYQRLSGANEIEGDDGEVREIVYTAKLIKKSTKYR